MNIFESLENLNVSEECFEDIVGLVEMYLSEDIHSAIDTYAKTDKKGRDELHRKASENKGNEIHSELTSVRNSEQIKANDDYRKKFHPMKKMSKRFLINLGKRMNINVLDKRLANDSNNRFWGYTYSDIQKDAGPQGKEVRNEEGEKYTKARSKMVKSERNK